MIKKLTYTAALCLFAFTQAQAQGVFTNSELNRSARSVAMGGLTTAMDANAFSANENASAVAFSERKAELGVQYSPWAMELTNGTDKNNLLVNVGGYYKIDETSSLVAGFSYYGIGGNKQYFYDNDGNLTGEGEICPSFLTLNFGYAHRFGEHWSASATVNYYGYDSGAKEQVGAVSFDFALTRRFLLQQAGSVDVSLKASNWGKTITGDTKDRYDVPGSVSVGGMWTAEFAGMHGVKVGVDGGYRLQDEKAWRLSAGAEYSFKQYGFARVGYYYTDFDTNHTSFAAVGLGGRLWDRAQLDVTYLIAGADSPLKNTFMIGVSVSF